MKNGAMVSPYSIWKVLIAGQASCFFGLVILILANFLIMPTPYFKNIVFLLLIGFCPSILFYYLTPRFVSYITIMNTLLITTMAVNMIGVTFLGSLFLLLPVLALFFRSKTHYLLASIGAILSYLWVAQPIYEPQQMVYLLAQLAILTILFFFIYVIVKELVAHSVVETKHVQTVSSLSRSVEAKDYYTRGHSGRVAGIAVILAAHYGGLDRKTVYSSGLIHDVGKLTTPDYILIKNGPLTPKEQLEMRKHPLEGAKICRSLGISEELIDGVLYHHERWDGKGYPEGLIGENIPLLGRLLCVADCIDAMASNRSYRQALSFEHICSELELGKGTQFDPHIATLALTHWEEITQFILEERVKVVTSGEVSEVYAN